MLFLAGLGAEEVPGHPLYRVRGSCTSRNRRRVQWRCWSTDGLGRSDRSAQGDRRTLRTIRPTRAKFRHSERLRQGLSISESQRA